MRTTQRFVLSLLSALLVFSAGAAWAQTSPSVLSVVPSNTALVVTTPNMRQLSDDLAALNTLFGLNDEMMTDVYGATTTMMGLGAGLAEDRAAAIAIMDLNGIFGSAPGESSVLVLPITDYNAFLGNFGATDTGAVTPINLMGVMPGFARQAGDFAILGFDETLVAGFDASSGNVASTVGALNDAALADSHIACLVNVPVVSATLLPLIDEWLAGMNTLFSATGELANSMELAQQMLSLYAEGARAVLTQTEWGVFGMTVEDGNVIIHGSAQFVAGSNMASMFGNLGSVDNRIAALPDRAFMFVMAAAMDADFSPMFNAISTLYDSDEPDPATFWIQAIEMFRGTTGMASAWYVPTDAGMDTLTVYETNGSHFQTGMQRMLEGMNELRFEVSPAGVAGPEASAITYSTTYEPGVSNVQGLVVDRFSTTTEYSGEMSEVFNEEFMASTGMSGYTGLLGYSDELAIMTTQPDEAILQQAASMWVSRSGLGADGTLATLRAFALEPELSLEGYADVSQMIGFLMSSIGVTDLPIGELGLVGILGVSRDGGFASTTVLPTEMIQALINMATAFDVAGAEY